MFKMDINEQSEKNRRDYELYLEANPHKRKCDFREHSTLTEKDLSEINKALEDYFGTDMGVTEDRCLFLDGYMSDSPGWSGKVCLVIYGEICYQTLLICDGNTKFAEKGWRVIYDISSDNFTVEERLGSEGKVPVTLKSPRFARRVCCQNPNNLES